MNEEWRMRHERSSPNEEALSFSASMLWTAFPLGDARWRRYAAIGRLRAKSMQKTSCFWWWFASESAILICLVGAYWENSRPSQCRSVGFAM